MCLCASLYLQYPASLSVRYRHRAMRSVSRSVWLCGTLHPLPRTLPGPRALELDVARNASQSAISYHVPGGGGGVRGACNTAAGGLPWDWDGKDRPARAGAAGCCRCRRASCVPRRLCPSEVGLARFVAARFRARWSSTLVRPRAAVLLVTSHSVHFRTNCQARRRLEVASRPTLCCRNSPSRTPREQ